jgi:hypothetical protein
VRPRFFAGQLLTEDDLSLLTDYVSGKSRLHNRMVSGPGVVCGLEVSCDPCGTVVVHPGHALDCRGDDIVLACKEKVDVQALVQELRVSSTGVRCGDPCDDEQRGYGLYVRYEESAADPVAPYATEEPCPTPGCVPSRVQEGFRFVVKCDTTDDHRYNPATKLLASIGDRDTYEALRLLTQRFGRYLDAMAIAGAASDRTFTFGPEDAARFTDSLEWLGQSGESPPTAPDTALQLTEHVRALASAIARYDTYDSTGQGSLQTQFPALKRVDDARQALGVACDRLDGADPAKMWLEEAHRSIALAVVAETRARIVTVDADAPIEVRLLAQGTPVSNVLAVELRSDLVRIREWLLGRLDRAPGVADCRLRDDVRTVALPQPLPTPEPDATRRLSVTDLGLLTDAAGNLTTYVRRFVTDAACATLNPPCVDCTDDDVLLAHLELDGCDVVRVCSATREQVLPGGSAYGEWLPKLYQLRHLAEQVCCQPIPVYTAATPSDTVIYVADLLEEWPRTGPLEQMWDLLVTPAPGETVPKAVREQVRKMPSEVTDSLQELNVLRSQMGDLRATVEALRSQLDTAREQVTQVREELPERLGDRLSELETAPPAEEPAEPPKPPARRTTRSSSTRKPRSGESS